MRLNSSRLFSNCPLDPIWGLFCGIMFETDKPMNLEIVAYKLHDGLWAFDYEPNGTVKELLMNGTEEVIDSYYYFYTGKEAKSNDKIRIYLSNTEEKDYDTLLKIKSGDADGTTYFDEVMCAEVWLCKWLDRYFGYAPNELWVRLDPVNCGLGGFKSRTKEAIQTYFSNTVFNKTK